MRIVCGTRRRAHALRTWQLEGVDQLAGVQVLPGDVKFWEKQGWRRLVPEDASSGKKPIVAMVKAVDPSKPLPAVEAPEAVVLRREQQLDATGLPLGRATN